MRVSVRLAFCVAMQRDLLNQLVAIDADGGGRGALSVRAVNSQGARASLVRAVSLLFPPHHAPSLHAQRRGVQRTLPRLSSATNRIAKTWANTDAVT
jgi:hypothetical protein